MVQVRYTLTNEVSAMRYVVTIVTGDREQLAAFGATIAQVREMPTPAAPAMLRAMPIR